MSRLICPHCGAATAFQAKKLTDVKTGPESQHSVEHILHYYVSSLYAYAIVENKSYQEPDYAILECAACSKTYLATKEQNKDWVASFPIAQTTVSETIPEKIRSAFQEARLSYAVKAYQACVAMCRTALIKLQREQGAEKEGLKSLYEQGKISSAMFERANELRHWANMAGHEDIPPDTISEQDCAELLTYMESLLEELYVRPAKLKQLTNKRKKVSKGTKIP